jgi:predicted aconitase with swiveling domain
VNLETEMILATGCVISNVPLVDKITKEAFQELESGMVLRVNADEGIIEIIDA